ncbi:MAG: nicotinate phosphoribosyltransferase [Bacteroidota bacterium]|nr:nicotinate phosphoribosyltransferase [Bacteroidota bacterium]
MNTFTATYTDQYQLAMSEVYFLNGKKDEKAVYDYFFRKTPFKGSYALFAGLETLLDVLEKFEFTPEDIKFLKNQGFNPKFLEYLKSFQFNGTIFSTREGDLVFPTAPVLTVEANIIEAQIIESMLLNILNFQTLIATKASRIRHVAGNKKLIDFGLRRAQSTGAYHASRAAFIGGFDATSNVKAGMDFNIPVSGTMAHAFIQAHDNELDAFRHFAQHHPNDCVLLVDTYDTLRIGLPNAIKVAKEMEKHGNRLTGIRLDSGDLAYLSKEARKMLDNAGLGYVKIAASNQLDEHLIKSLCEQGAKIDVYGVGTGLITGQPDAALDGVFKLAHFRGKDRIKLSNSTTKITLPGKKHVFRTFDTDGNFFGVDIVCMSNEKMVNKIVHPHDSLKSMETKHLKTEPVLYKVIENGKRIQKKKSTVEIAKFAKNQLMKLTKEYKRLQYSHLYKVGISDQLNTERNNLIKFNKKKQ